MTAPSSRAPGEPGRLVLVPAPLDFGYAEPAPIEEVLPMGTLRVAATLTHWVCENAKSARAVLKRIDAITPLALPLQAQQITELPHAVHKKGDHDPQVPQIPHAKGVRQRGGASVDADARTLLAPALLGHDVGLLSEAGMPAVADPGSAVVRAAHALGLQVVPLVGPVSLLLALAASGLNGQHFAFVGYLPQEPAARATSIRALEAHALKSGQTQIAIETPYRNAALLQALLDTLHAGTRLAVSAGLTLPTAETRSAAVSQWREAAWPPPGKHTPAVFAWGR